MTKPRYAPILALLGLFILLATANAQAPTQPTQVLCLTAYEHGFDMENIPLSSGTFWLMIFHHARPGFLSLSLTKDGASASVASSSLDKPGAYWLTQMTLAPGKYYLRESNHPNWSVTLTVEGSN